MESPPARSHDAALLRYHLDASPAQRFHRRRVSRVPQVTSPDDTFFTPLNSPQPNSLIATSPGAKVGSPRGGQASGNGSQQSSLSPARHQAHGRAPPSSLDPGPEFHDAHTHAHPTHPQSSTPGGIQTGKAFSSRRHCAKCGGDITGHFVRALGVAYHIDCFTCEDCGVPCAAKFFPVDGKPLCEHCYFKRQNLLCFRCGGSLRGSYITALDRKYHVEHFTCSLCTTVFGPEDSYFEYKGDMYCHVHYAALFAFSCEGCRSPILKQFVETYRGGRQQQWHPECYMIFKFWSVKVADPQAQEYAELRRTFALVTDPSKPLDPRANELIAHEDAVDRQSMRIWTTLCGFEEASASEISSLVRYAVDGRFRDAYTACTRLVALVKVLFTALDCDPMAAEAEIAKGKEVKTLCRKIVSYMSLLSKTRHLGDGERVKGLANDLLVLASSMAHYLKVLIRQGLSGALRLGILDNFLNMVAHYAGARPAKTVSPFSTDRCATCDKAVEDKCYRQAGRNDRLWHANSKCFRCSNCEKPLTIDSAVVEDPSGRLLGPECSKAESTKFIVTSRLEQYIILLHVALARLDLVLNNDRRTQSHNTAQRQNTMVEQASSSTPALATQKTSDLAMGTSSGSGCQPSTLERTSTILHEKQGLTLDDIRRIVASEQAKTASQIPDRSVNLASMNPIYPSPERPGVSSKAGKTFGMLDEEEYAWVQYIAQALVKPYAQEWIQRDIETIDFTGQQKQPTLWGRMGKVFKQEPDSRVFGQPLDRLVSKHGVDSTLGVPDAGKYTLRIPSFVDDCVQAMRQKDMSVEGIFRKNGNIRRIREFVEKIDRNPDENGLLVDESPIQLAALLKKFLRDLPDPLMSSRLASLWTALPRMNNETRHYVAQLCVATLPRANRNLLEVLVHFLNWVSGFAQIDEDSGSKMDIANLSTVLGPTLVLSDEEAAAAAFQRPSSDNDDEPSSSSPGGYKNASGSVKLLISEYTLVSQVSPDILKILRKVKTTPPRKLTSKEALDLLKGQ